MVSRALQLFQELCTSIVLSPPQPCLVHNKGDKVQTFFCPFVTFAPLSNWYCETIVLSHGWFFFFDFGHYATLCIYVLDIIPSSCFLLTTWPQRHPAHSNSMWTLIGPISYSGPKVWQQFWAFSLICSSFRNNLLEYSCFETITVSVVLLATVEMTKIFLFVVSQMAWSHSAPTVAISRETRQMREWRRVKQRHLQGPAAWRHAQRWSEVNMRHPPPFFFLKFFFSQWYHINTNWVFLCSSKI